MKTAWIVSLLLVAYAGQLFAQQPSVHWSGEFRLRSEIDARDFQNRTAPNLYTVSRTRLGATIGVSEQVTAFIQLQDSRWFGEATTPLADMSKIDLHQGYMRIQDLLVPDLTLTLGRFEASYGNQKIISHNGFHNVGRSFDGMIARYKTGKHTADLLIFNTREIDAPSGVSNKFKSRRDGGELLAGLYAVTTALDNHQIDLFGLYQTNRRLDSLLGDSLSRWTLGGLVKGKRGSVFYEADAAVQIGTTFGRDIFAYGGGVKAGYDVGAAFLSTVFVALDYCSGHKITETGAFGAFDPPFSSGHVLFGFMDYFISIPTQTNNRGLIDLFLRAELPVLPSLNTQLTIHYFQTPYSYSPAIVAKDLGTEIDLVTTWKPLRGLSLELGTSVFLPGAVMKAIYGGSDPGMYVYATSQVVF